MKLDLRFTLCAFAILFASGSSLAQIWTNYECIYKMTPFEPLASSSIVIPRESFLSETSIDPGDGIAADIPVGFVFDYNGNMYSTVNVCVNGWASVGIQKPSPTITDDNAFLFLPNRPNN